MFGFQDGRVCGPIPSLDGTIELTRRTAPAAGPRCRSTEALSTLGARRRGVVHISIGSEGGRGPQWILNWPEIVRETTSGRW